MRWEVFKQDAPGKPHQAVGSVHASDAQGALINARHVFARRPAAVSLWVAPATAVCSWTLEQLAAGRPEAPADTCEAEGPVPTWRGSDAAGPLSYLVFCKTSNRRSMTFVDHVGDVVAESPDAALDTAKQLYGSGDTLVWWLVPAGAITKSAPADVQAWFEPAKDKTYKQQSAYASLRPNAGTRRGS